MVVLLESKCMFISKVNVAAKARYLTATSTFGVNLHLFLQYMINYMGRDI